MKLALEQLLELEAAHQALARYDVIEAEVLVFRVGHNLRALRPHAEDARKSVRSLLTHHGAKLDAQGRADPAAPLTDVDAYRAASKALMAEEVEVTGLLPITWALLQSARIVLAAKEGAEQVPLPLNGAVLAGLGDLLTGEPTEAATTAGPNGVGPQPPRASS